MIEPGILELWGGNDISFATMPPTKCKIPQHPGAPLFHTRPWNIMEYHCIEYWTSHSCRISGDDKYSEKYTWGQYSTVSYSMCPSCIAELNSADPNIFVWSYSVFMRCCVNPGANQVSWESTLPENEQHVPCLGAALLRPAVNKSPGRSIER